MSDTGRKVSSGSAPTGADGEVRLVSGTRMTMRMWRDEEPTSDKPPSRHAYEVVGYALKGRAELLVDGETLTLEPGDSWLVPAGAEHRYRILETFTAVETTSAPSGNGA